MVRYLRGAVVLPLLFAGCDEPELPPIKEPLKLYNAEDESQPKVVSIEQLRRGQEQYTLYCRPCHGVKGDGKGPAGRGLFPPPRDFSSESLAFKFAGVEAGNLPPDAELLRVVKGGLDGTAMLPWDVPDPVLVDIIQYIKTFNPIWAEEAPAEVVEVASDPWTDKREEALSRGSKVYHGLAQCLQCHPAYATKQEIYDASKELSGNPITTFRPNMYEPEAKMSEAFGHKLLPPDFGRNRIKSGHTPRDLFRTIASGIGGTAMPMWKGSLPDEDIWAVAHFVADIASQRDRPAYRTMMDRLKSAPAWEPPPVAEDDAAAEGEAPAEADSDRE